MSDDQALIAGYHFLLDQMAIIEAAGRTDTLLYRALQDRAADLRGYFRAKAVVVPDDPVVDPE